MGRISWLIIIFCRNESDVVRRMSELIGVPVMDYLNGKELGDVCDVLFDEQSNTLLGVMTESIMGKGLWISREDIRSISPLGILGVVSLCRILGRHWSDKVGTQIYARDGQLRGTVSDVYADEDFFEIVGYEVSDGLFEDLPKGHTVFLEREPFVDSDALMGCDTFLERG